MTLEKVNKLNSNFVNESSSIVIGDSRPDLLCHETLPDLFRSTANNNPDKVALIFQEKSLTYAQLDCWSDAVAASLSQKGIGRGAAVGVWWPRGLELHVIILGISKAGASYVPLDREMPADRVATVLAEVQAAACFSQEPLDLTCPILSPPALETPVSVTELPLGPQPDDWAYVIYTSGSTGKPKGIPISHRQICHLVRSEQSVLKIRSDDKVYQGFSISFDMWCEETWISYSVGATIWVADATTAKSFDELGQVLSQNQITVLHAVPSLLAVMEDCIPSLRLVNAGGEACTKPVLERWGNSTRQFFNTYGPTETTVTASIASLKRGDTITIGKPLPNYGFAVVDEHLNPLQRGQRGELVISGLGVAEGYLNRPDQTQEKFVVKPASLAAMPGDRIYRSGDAALMNAEGDILIQGRFDDQIKLRGYRIELGEIESQLNQVPKVAAAAVALKKDTQGNDYLVGYLVWAGDEALSESEIRLRLAKELPPYMVPSHFVTVTELPRLTSGKIDRKSLPTPEALLKPATDYGNPIDLNAPLAERMKAVLQRVFPHQAIDETKDFFNDLGGHSLLAAEFVSHLRREGGLKQASIKEIYSHRPLGALLKFWEEENKVVSAPKAFHPTPLWRYLLCGTGQLISLFFIYGLFAAQIFWPYLAYYYVLEETSSHAWGFAAALGSFCFIPPLFTGITVAAKWIVIGRMKAGDYPLWGWYYFRWWFVKTMQKLMPIEYINGTPLYPRYFRMMGVKVASDAQLSELSIGAEDLVTIGEDVSISSSTVLDNAVVEEGFLKLRPVHIGDHAYIGTASVIGGGSRIEEWGEMKDLSYLRPGEVVKAREVWGGSPAVHQTTKTPEELPEPLKVSEATRRKYSRFYLLLLLFFPFTVLVPLLPSIYILYELDNAWPDYDFTYLFFSPFISLLYVGLFVLLSVVATRLLQRNLKPGTYPIYSRVYAKKWFTDQLMNLALFVLHPVFATVYTSPLYRALGAKVGKNAEISTACQVTHRLLEVGDGAFVADLVTLGEDDVRGQRLTLTQTTIGKNSFVGNSGLIPQGYQLPNDMLIGVLSVPPTPEQLATSDAKTWLGSPAIGFPRRQESQAFPEHLTVRPTRKRKLARALVEAIRILIPSSAVMSFSVLFIAYGHDLLIDESWWNLFLQFPLYYLGFVGLPALLLTVVLKWIFVGRYKPGQQPMWTWKVWVSEAITSTYEALTVPFLLEYLRGTPFLAWALRLLGVRIGKRVYLNTTDVTEYDVVEIGDESVLNHECGPQTHLFEDRVMKIGSVKIGARCCIGARSVVLYNSELGDGASLEALSLVMKGESIPPQTNWGGSPVKPA